MRGQIRRILKDKTMWIIVVAILLIIGAFFGGEKIIMTRDEAKQAKIEARVALPYENDVSIPWLPKTVSRFSEDINAQAKKYNINANFLAVLMTLESGGYTKADSGFARGLLQISPTTADDIAAKYLKTPVKNYDLFDEKTSVEFGAAYIAWLRNNYCNYKDGPTWDFCAEAIAAGYNGGPGALADLVEGRGLKYVETAIYSRNALNMWRERSAKTSPTFQRWYDAGGNRLIKKAEKELKKLS